MQLRALRPASLELTIQQVVPGRHVRLLQTPALDTSPIDPGTCCVLLCERWPLHTSVLREGQGSDPRVQRPSPILVQATVGDTLPLALVRRRRQPYITRRHCSGAANQVRQWLLLRSSLRARRLMLYWVLRLRHHSQRFHQLQLTALTRLGVPQLKAPQQ